MLTFASERGALESLLLNSSAEFEHIQKLKEIARMIFMFSDHSYLARWNSWEQFLRARERLDREVIMLSRAIAFIFL